MLPHVKVFRMTLFIHYVQKIIPDYGLRSQLCCSRIEKFTSGISLSFDIYFMKSFLITYRKEQENNIIKESEWIHSPKEWVFRAMTDIEWINEWGGGPAKFHLKPGGKYYLWDGEFYGIILDFKINEKLSFTLREHYWQSDWKDSIVIIELTEERQGTRFNLQHSSLPNEKVFRKHELGWGEYYIGPLKAYLENLYFAELKKNKKIPR